MSKTKFSDFSKNLVNYFTTEIIDKEKLLSKSDPFKYKIDKRVELGDEYLSDSSDIESNTDDFASTDEYRSSTDIADTNSDNLKTEQVISGSEYSNFAFNESDISERNQGDDDI